jgi:Zn finger protein HypA/HybF involved in hydrogenase expression
MPSKIKAIYECCKCQHTYEGRPGPQLPCPLCHSKYLKWLNYEELNKKYFKN